MTAKLLLKTFLISLFSFFIVSCSSSGEEQVQEVKLEAKDFKIEVNGDLIQFNEQTISIKKLNLNNDISIIGVDWYFDNKSYSESNQPEIKISFPHVGNLKIKAKIYLSNDQVFEIDSQVTLTEKEYNVAQIKGVSIIGMESHILNTYKYTSNYYNRVYISLRSKFTISSIKDGTIYYISGKNFVNNRTRDFKQINWDGPNLNVKVYEGGIPDVKFAINFYGQNVEKEESEKLMISDEVSFKDYRLIKPQEIEFTSQGLTYKLLIEWIK